VKSLACQGILTDDDVTKILAYLHQHYMHLETLVFPKNQLSSLQHIANAARVQYSTLRKLDVSGNPAAMPDLSLLVDILTTEDTCRVTHLNLSNNGIGTRKGADFQVKRLLEQNTSIMELRISHNHLGSKAMKSIAEALRNNETLKNLDVSYNKIGNSGLCRLTSNLAISKTFIQSLDLTFNKIGSNGAVNLANLLLDTNRTIKILNLSLNMIGAEGCVLFGSVLKYNHVLEELNLSRNDIREGVVSLAEGLLGSEVTHLRRLDLSWNSLTDQGAEALANVLQKNSVLESLKLSSNAIGDDGVCALADALHADMALSELDIVGNQMRNAAPLVRLICNGSYSLEKLAYEQNKLSPEQESRLKQAFEFRMNKSKWLGKLLEDIAKKKVINLNLSSRKYNYGDEEIIAISKQLTKYKPKVTALSIHSQLVTDRGIIAFANNLQHGEAVERLFLRNCSLSIRGISAFAKTLECPNCSLRLLSFTSCNIDVRGAQAVANALETCTALKRLSLESNRIGDLGAKALLSAVLNPPHVSLKSLNLANNQLSDQALVNLGPFIKLEELHLDNNNIMDYGALDIAKAVIGSNSIRWLNLSRNCISDKGLQAIKLFLRTAFILDSEDQRSL
jgi:Ran GTPase-activating protein (RanGAP) involved in mRNA processing and transport